MKILVALLVSIICACGQPVLPVINISKRIVKYTPSKEGALDKYVRLDSIKSAQRIDWTLKWTYAYWTTETVFIFERTKNFSSWTPFASTTNFQYTFKFTNNMDFFRMHAYHPSLNYRSPYASR